MTDTDMVTEQSRSAGHQAAEHWSRIDRRRGAGLPSNESGPSHLVPGLPNQITALGAGHAALADALRDRFALAARLAEAPAERALPRADGCFPPGSDLRPGPTPSLESIRAYPPCVSPQDKAAKGPPP